MRKVVDMMRSKERMCRKKLGQAVLMCFINTGLVLVLTGCDKLRDFAVLWESESAGYVIASEEMVDDVTASCQETETSKQIYVHVAGEVRNPGVYTLLEGSRVYEAIAAAGGFTEQAVSEGINQARILVDGEQLVVWNAEQVAQGVPESLDSASQVSQKININTADKESLMTLPGIGETRAQDILDWRQTHGEFAAIEDIMKVPGIKEYAFQKMKEYITVQ